MYFTTPGGTLGYDLDRPLSQQIDEVADVVHHASKLAFTHVTAGQHWLAGEEIWMQPIPMLARLAPISGDMKLATTIIQMPMYNPVEVAEQVSTMDHITNGRFVLGLGNGYREVELEAAGVTRRERAPRVEESIEIMKRLWAGEDLDFKGRFWNVKGRMALTPVQKPGPPIWIAVHAEAAARRAARLADGALMAPQIYREDLKRLCDAYEDECAKVGRRGMLGISRRLVVLKNKDEHEGAVNQLRADAQHSVERYHNWDMQEKGMVNIHLDSRGNDPLEYSIVGDAEDCVDQLNRCKEEFRMDLFTGGLANAPRDLQGRKDWMQFVSEEVLSKI